MKKILDVIMKLAAVGFIVSILQQVFDVLQATKDRDWSSTAFGFVGGIILLIAIYLSAKLFIAFDNLMMRLSNKRLSKTGRDVPVDEISIERRGCLVIALLFLITNLTSPFYRSDLNIDSFKCWYENIVFKPMSIYCTVFPLISYFVAVFFYKTREWFMAIFYLTSLGGLLWLSIRVGLPDEFLGLVAIALFYLLIGGFFLWAVLHLVNVGLKNYRINNQKNK